MLETIFVVKGLQASLLGLPAITSMELACRVNLIEQINWITKYPEVFEGLGTMGEEYVIQLKPNAQTYAIYTPRQIPLQYHGKVMKELQRMEALGVISGVEEPTVRCSGMVSMPKKNGSMHICVDLYPFSIMVKLRKNYREWKLWE